MDVSELFPRERIERARKLLQDLLRRPGLEFPPPADSGDDGDDGSVLVGVRLPPRGPRGVRGAQTVLRKM